MNALCTDSRRPCAWTNSPWRRGIDIAGALAGLILTAPLHAGLALVVRVVDGRPVFFVQPRAGLGNRPFPLLKLRTMRRPEEASAERAAVDEGEEPEATGLGAFLRRLRLDELPQLVNVLAGHMSLVGPRPEQPHLSDAYARTIPRFRERLNVRPGITGLAQVSLPPGQGEEYSRRKLRFDIEYIEKASPLLDARILLKTVPSIWRNRNGVGPETRA